MTFKSADTQTQEPAKYISPHRKRNMKANHIFHRVLGLLCLLNVFTDAEETSNRWLRNSGYGVMFHYQVFKDLTPSEYNRTIDSFNVTRWADSIQKAGAGHVIFAIGQNWGKYCAPNSAYEQLLNVENGQWTSKRDLILEIGRALQDRNIRLIVYATARAPMQYHHIIKSLEDALPTMNGKIAPASMPTMRKTKGFVRSEHQPPPVAFLKNWGAVYAEWSMRYRDLVDGWWIDGYKRAMADAYEPLQKEPYNIDTWVSAIRSGNPHVEIAFNAGAYPGAALCADGKLCKHQTYTAGEAHGFIREFKGQSQILTPKNFPAPAGVIWHLLFPLSDGWGAGSKPESLYTAQYLITGIDEINAQGGAVTFDIPCSADGTIPPAIQARLQQLAKVKSQLTDGEMSYNGIKISTHKKSAKAQVVHKQTESPKIARKSPALAQWSPELLETTKSSLVIDVSNIIKGAGSYTFSFIYRKGSNGANIKAAALFNGDTQVAQDTHEGFSGKHLHNVTYTLNIVNYEPKGRYTLHADIEGNGGNDSYGDIIFNGVK